MKIVYNINGTFNSGGMERVLANKANYLAGLGHELFIVTTDQQEQAPYFPLDERIRSFDLGINYAENNRKGLIRKVLGYPGKQRLHRKRLARLLVDLKADIVISMFDNDADLLWRIDDGSKKVLEIHFSRFKRQQYGRKGIWKLIDTFRSRHDLKIVQRYDAFVVLTEEDKGYWGDLHNICVIPNANSFQPDTVATLDTKRVIAVGRYDYQKSFDDLIQVWSRVHASVPDWKLDIFGHGELHHTLQELIDRLKLKDVVTLRPPTRDIQSEYLQSSVLAMTSRYEGLPMALLEAQACGLPLVSYACKCGPLDLIEQGANGYLLAEGDREGMAQKLICLMQDEGQRRRMGAAGRKNSMNYSEGKIMQRWIDLFEQLIRENNG